MRKENRELLRLFENFRKLNVASILPNLTHGEFAVLKAVRTCGKEQSCDEGIGISDIVKQLRIPPPAVSRTMKYLEERELIVRSVNKKDRRTVYVRLTEKGAAKLEEAEQIINEYQEAVFGNIGVENMNRLIKYMQELQEVMATELELRKFKGSSSEDP